MFATAALSRETPVADAAFAVETLNPYRRRGSRNDLGRYTAGLAVLLLLFVVGGWRVQSEEPKATTGEAQPERLRAITTREALELVQRNKENPNFVILDVRTPEEFKSGYIEGAINIDYYGPGFPVEIGKLDRTKTYLVYCRTGNRTRRHFCAHERAAVQGGLSCRGRYHCLARGRFSRDRAKATVALIG